MVARWFHRHKFEPVAVNQWSKKTPLYIGSVGFPMTSLLERCKCGARRTSTLDGHWTLEALARSMGADEREDAQ